MSEEKKPTKTTKKKTVKIKATTGAWWKSTSAEVENPPESGAEDTTSVKKTTKKAATPERPEKAKPAAGNSARKPRTTKTAANKPAVADTSAAEVEVVLDVAPSMDADTAGIVREDVPDTAKPKRKVGRKSTSRSGTSTRGRKKTVSEGETVEPSEQTPVQPEVQLTAEIEKGDSLQEQAVHEQASSAEPEAGVAESVTEGDSQAAAETGSATPEATEQVAKSKRKPRSRRGRKSKTQQTAKSAEQVEVAEVEEGEDVVDEDAAETEDIETLTDSETGKEETVDEQKQDTKKVYKLLINAEEPEECRLALLEDGRLESIHVSTVARMQTKNNIYKARIVALEPSLQAAFVEYGREKNGFLPFSEIHPEYYKQELSDDVRQLVEKNQWKKISITDVMEKGQEVLAQVVKEEVGKKGANMTTYLSIPGRCVVLMPGSDSSGISRKISGEEKRSQLRDVMNAIEMPEGIGWIVRTASVDITENALNRDVENLLKVWDDIKRRGQEMDGVGLVYEDHQSIQRFLREHFDPSIEEILVDDRDAMEQVKAFIDTLPSAQRDVKVRLHQGARPIFNHFSVEDQIESIYQPRVNLPSGGSIVIDPTEALVAIDVNSGSTSKGKNFEASIFQANMEAAAELARQLRLRDLGGLIVVDFIDMRNKKHVQAVERQVRQAMKRDKAKVDFTRISKFGLMQISRQKLGAPIEAGNYRRCEHCQGRGIVRSVETLSLFYLRRIQTGASRKHVVRIECHFPLDVASYLLNFKRSELREMEDRYHVEILIISEPDMRPMDNDIVYHKAEKDQTGKKQA